MTYCVTCQEYSIIYIKGDGIVEKFCLKKLMCPLKFLSQKFDVSIKIFVSKMKNLSQKIDVSIKIFVSKI